MTTSPVPYVHTRPALPRQPAPPLPTSGNFTVRDDLRGPALAPYWLMIRTPRERWHDFTSAPGWLTLRARPVDLDARGQPSFVGRRQQHQRASASTAMRFVPEKAGDKAGIAAFQNDDYYYFLGVTLAGGRRVVRLERHAKPDSAAGASGARPPARSTIVAEAPLAGPAGGTVYLKIDARGPRYDFSYARTPGQWTVLARDQDGTILSTKVAGGFVGATFGMFAYSAP